MGVSHLKTVRRNTEKRGKPELSCRISRGAKDYSNFSLPDLNNSDILWYLFQTKYCLGLQPQMCQFSTLLILDRSLENDFVSPV